MPLLEADWDRAVSVVTDAERVAEFEIDSAAPFALLLRARGADGPERVAEVELPGPSAAEPAGVHETGLQPPQLVRGFVVDVEGRSLARVRAELTDASPMAYTLGSVVTNDARRFEFQFLRSDRWSFRLAADGFAPQVLELSTSQNDRDIVLTPTSVLSGYLRVADPQDVVDLNLLRLRREVGVPLESASIELLRLDGIEIVGGQALDPGELRIE